MSRKPCRILIADDNREIRESLAMMLSEEGFDVVTAANGLEALFVVNGSNPPDLIVLDLIMPVVSGQEVLTMLREHRRLARIPVIVLSAFSSQLTVGASASLPKPIQFDRLLELVHEHCQ